MTVLCCSPNCQQLDTYDKFQPEDSSPIIHSFVVCFIYSSQHSASKTTVQNIISK